MWQGPSPSCCSHLQPVNRHPSSPYKEFNSSSAPVPGSGLQVPGEDNGTHPTSARGAQWHTPLAASRSADVSSAAAPGSPMYGPLACPAASPLAVPLVNALTNRLAPRALVLTPAGAPSAKLDILCEDSVSPGAKPPGLRLCMNRVQATGVILCSC